jgi:penicillin amidase
MADYQDLYRERLRRTTAGVEALGPDGGWRPTTRHTETVEVADAEPVEIEVIETERGPVVIGEPGALVSGSGVVVGGSGVVFGESGVVVGGSGAVFGEPGVVVGGSGAVGGDAGEEAAISLRYPPRVTHDLGFSALLPLLRARTVADVDRALDRWAEPVNVVQAADTEGGLLHRVAGKVPVRHADNRTRVVPAWVPGHEWRGWHEMPYGTVDDGIAVMANQRGPSTPLGVEFAPPHRAARIHTLLTARQTWSAPEMAAVHMDTHLASAAPLLARLDALDEKALSPRAAAVRARLLSWNRHMDADSTDAAAYAAVRGAVVRRLAAHPALSGLTDPPAYPEIFRPWLALTPRVGYALENLLGARELYGIDRAAIVREAVEEAVEEAAAAAAAAAAGSRSGAGTGVGDGVRDLTWGDTHRLAPWHALASDPYDEPGLSGDHDCVLCTSAVPGVTDRAARGPAARYVWDLARRDDSLWVVPLGASGIPGSPHHRDQLPLWLKGDLAPVVTDWSLLHPLTKENDDH